MTNEFTDICTHCYQLRLVIAKRQERLQVLIDSAPGYNSQITTLSEIDAIIAYYRKMQSLKAKIDKTEKDMQAAEKIILAVMRHFEIPPGTMFTGVIPYELEYEVWASENDTIFINKIKDLAPEVHNPNIIKIKLWNPYEDYEEEED